MRFAAGSDRCGPKRTVLAIKANGPGVVAGAAWMNRVASSRSSAAAVLPDIEEEIHVAAAVPH